MTSHLVSSIHFEQLAQRPAIQFRIDAPLMSMIAQEPVVPSSYTLSMLLPSDPKYQMVSDQAQLALASPLPPYSDKNVVARKFKVWRRVTITYRKNPTI